MWELVSYFPNSDYFSGVMRFNSIVMFLNFLLLLYFIVSWYYTYKKTGWKADLWHFTLLMIMVIPFILMYPFNASELNYVSLKNMNDDMEPYVNIAYLISFIGYVSMIFGRYLYDNLKTNTVLMFLKPLSAIVERAIRFNIKSVFMVRIFSFLVIFSIAVLVYFQISNGYLGNVRAYFMVNQSVRPVYNFVASAYQLVFVFLSLRYLYYKDKLDLMLILLLFLGSLFLGTRSMTLGPLLTGFFFYVFYKRGQVSLLKIAGVGASMLLLALMLEALRSSSFNPLAAFLGLGVSIAYGNNFSDTRDFALFLSAWDWSFVGGNTYLAGLMSFIPSSLSDYRTVWSIGRFTNDFLGFDSTIHPGIRPGLFGESFINFGIIGVILMGTVAGYFLRYADYMLKKSIEFDQDVVKAYSVVFIYTIISFFYITAGFFQMYTFIVIMFMMMIGNLVLNSAVRKFKK